MRGLRLMWGAAAATILMGVVFITLRHAHAAVQVEGETQRNAVQSAVPWLVLQHQNEDGGFTAFSNGADVAPSDVAGTTDAVLALASTGYNVAVPYPGRDRSAIDYLRDNPEAVAGYASQSGGAAGKLILALTAAAQDPLDFRGYNLAISLTEHLSPTGQYNVISPFEQSLAILAQSVVSDDVPAEAIDWLLSVQAQDGELAGSWDDGFGTAGNIDATSMAMMALVAAGQERNDAAVAAGRQFLLQNQLESGGWGYAPGLPESANSTALALQALSALGEDFYSADSEWTAEGGSPLAALLSWQAESGALQADFGDGPADDFFSTVQALPALTGRSYPLPARFEAARRGVSCLATMRDLESGGWPEFAGAGPSAGGTARAMRAIAATGEDVGSAEWTVDGVTPLEALRTLAPAYLESGRGGRVGLVLRGAAVGGEDGVDFGGLDLPMRMSDYLSPTGEYDDTSFGPYSHAQAMLGLLSAGHDVHAPATQWLLEAQGTDGGWGSPDATGISLQVLGSLPGEAGAEATTAAIQNLRMTQQDDGGWGFAFPSSVNSTAEVVQGLVDAGENPFDPTWSVVTSGTLRNGADLALAQQGSNGCWPNLFGEGDDPYATTDGIILLSQSPVWGAVPEGEAGADPTVAVTTVVEATSTPETIVEATEAVPTPTARVVVDETPLATEVASNAAEDVAEGTATPFAEGTAAASADATETPTNGGEEDPGSLLWWIAGAILLLVLVMFYFRLTARR